MIAEFRRCGMETAHETHLQRVRYGNRTYMRSLTDPCASSIENCRVQRTNPKAN
jgi:hypothetical protein